MKDEDAIIDNLIGLSLKGLIPDVRIEHCKVLAHYILAREHAAYQKGRESLSEVVNAVKEFVEFYEKHCSYEEEKTETLQEAANLARQGRGNEANNILRRCDKEPRVFDYSKVNKGLVSAIRSIQIGG